MKTDKKAKGRQLVMIGLLVALALSTGYVALPRVVPAGHQAYEVLNHFHAKNMLVQDRDLYRRGEVMERNQMALITMRLVNHCLQPANEGRVTSWDIRRLLSLVDEFERELKDLFDLDVEDARWRLGRLASSAPPEPGIMSARDVSYSDLPASFGDPAEEKPRFIVEFEPAADIREHLIRTEEKLFEDEEFDRLITINARNTGVRDILFLLFKDTSFSLDVDERGMDRMTIQLKDVPLRNALNLVLERGIAVRRSDDLFIFSMTTEEEQEIIRLEYVKASDIIETLRRFRGPRGSVEADERTNSVIVKDSVENIERIKEMIFQVDVESEDTVSITKVFQFRYTNASDMRTLVADLRSQDGKMEVDRRLNALVVQDKVRNVRRMAELFNALDVPAINPGLVSRVYRINYADANEVKRILDSEVMNQGGTAGDTRAVVQVDTRTNSLIISDFRQRHELIEEYISLLDTPVRQVHIEAKIMEISMVDRDLFGIKWSTMMPESGSKKTLEEETIYEMDFSEADAALSQLKFGTLARDQFTLLLQFLMNQTQTQILATPSITVIDKDEAEINVGASVPIPRYERNATTGNMEVTGYEEKRTGITLNVKPEISHSGQVLLDVRPKIDEITEYRGQFNEIPVTSNREARTRILVQDGRTLVIAGLIKETVAEGHLRVPFLHRLPLIGTAFRRSRTITEKNETVIFITPNIINSGGV